MSRTLIYTFLVVALGVISSGSLKAEVSIINDIEAEGNIRIDQPNALARLLVFVPQIAGNENLEEVSAAHHHSGEVRMGYRVQVFDDNNPRTARADAALAESRMKAEFPHLRTYLSFNSPYWRVKVGDFRTRAEAESVLAEIRQSIPNLAPYLRVMRDKINIID